MLMFILVKFLINQTALQRAFFFICLLPSVRFPRKKRGAEKITSSENLCSLSFMFIINEKELERIRLGSCIMLG